jgi:hypothetical protein
MTTKLRAHFDGKVLVPDEPVDLPVGQALEVEVAASIPSPLADLASLVESLPTNPGPKTDRAAQHDHYLYGSSKRE